MRTPVLWMVVLLLSAPAAAQRQPVLKQVQVPHSYYWREMYVPQVSSGPTSVAWSPDGRELVYSMQGALWRQAVGTTRARQLTNTPGYDHQPDWSPDGRFVAYASYRDDAIELRMLEAATGRTWALTENRAVNLEPRFSPDGRRLAFVSTAFEGRWHVNVMALDEGRPGAIARITEDKDSGLPRYYYSKWDHYLSPAWSPDGSELLVVSNRGRIYGTGGFWRMKAEPGAAMRELRYEETTWKARPDWARDGRRVVYASYAGSQWHQLWLMTAEGGDPFQLTYGGFDATAPRWSPDARRIAFVSNEDGNTALRVIEVPGGRVTNVEAREREHLGPVAKLEIVIRAQGSSEPLPARVSVMGEDGRYHAPDAAWRHADDGFDRRERKLEYGYYHWSPDKAALTVPAGRTTIEVHRGLEWRPFRAVLDLAAGESRRVDVALERPDDLQAKGWWSGDVHVHMNYAGTYRNMPERLRAQMHAEDVHVVESLIVNKEQRIPDIAYFDRGRVDPASDARALIVHGEEYHTSFWGHTALLGLLDHFVMPNYAGYVNTGAASLYPHNVVISDEARSQGALVGYVHLYDTPPDPKAPGRLSHEFPVDVALGKVDYFEAVGFDESHLTTQSVWYRLLNLGFRVPAAGGTDAMANYASLHGPVGLCRTYARSGTLDHGKWLAALKAGRTIATNGPLLELTLGGREIGDEITLAKPGTLEAKVRMRSIVPVDHVQLVGNGEVVAEVPASADRTSAEATLKVAVRKSGWYVLRAFTEQGRHPVLDFHVSGTTSSIYVTVGGALPRSKADAEYFLAWIDKMEAASKEHPDYNSPAERDAILRSLDEARAEFRRRQ
ncbi:MAG TPA: CehA/McbA family metallohydrolase [Vicinamibacteria bacterium]|nr:CehA/McbA family metallohydrolase [Vicinamibacteria bacterium]